MHDPVSATITFNWLAICHSDGTVVMLVVVVAEAVESGSVISDIGITFRPVGIIQFMKDFVETASYEEEREEDCVAK